MKRVIILMAMLVLVSCVPVMAKTDIFGQGRQAAFEFGTNTAQASWRFIPVDQFKWGPQITGLLTDDAGHAKTKWDTTLIGVGIEYPVFDLASMIPNLPVEAVGFAAGAIDIDIEHDFQAYVPTGVGFDVRFNEHVNLRTFIPLIDLVGNDDDSLTRDQLRVGVAVRW